MPEVSYNYPVTDASLVACPHCDLLQRLPNLTVAASARCPRCNEELWRRREDPLNRTFALAVAAAIVYLVANSVPMLRLTVVGREAATTVIGGAQDLWNSGQQLVAILVLFTAVIFPALQIVFTLVIVLGARARSVPFWVGKLLRHHRTTQTWSMIEVMMLGVLVALVKIADYATVIPGTALYMLGVLIVLIAAMQVSLEPREIWDKIEWAQPPRGDQRLTAASL
jgi:paraquat-inducible protein A